MTDIAQLAQTYVASFNETDEHTRRHLLEEIYTPDSTYTDPHVELSGPAEIDAFIAQTQERFPGFTFRLGEFVDAHHGVARFQWHAGPDEEPSRFVGFDVIVVDDAKIRSVLGFMDVAPAA